MPALVHFRCSAHNRLKATSKKRWQRRWQDRLQWDRVAIATVVHQHHKVPTQRQQASQRTAGWAATYDQAVHLFWQ
jgi:hypothetical protein